ncbi:MAG: hypothetical protein RMN52_04810 [Anaerolineae bacterium]|nr:hypothetical protein [Candidatus Roseilinea sp.]MDW8449303.1 hypothetical protein [Anaerolineae bacterium]
MAKLPRRRSRRRGGRVLMRVTGENLKDGWLTVQVPARLAIAIVLAALVLCVAVALSPELAARIAALLVRLTQ